MTTKQIEATQRILANLGCETDVVYYCCPRGYNNETELLPIPTSFRAEAEELASHNDEMEHGGVMLLPIADLTKSQMLTIWQWSNAGIGDAADLLKDEWAMKTWAGS